MHLIFHMYASPWVITTSQMSQCRFPWHKNQGCSHFLPNKHTHYCYQVVHYPSKTRSLGPWPFPPFFLHCSQLAYNTNPNRYLKKSNLSLSRHTLTLTVPQIDDFWESPVWLAQLMVEASCQPISRQGSQIKGSLYLLGVSWGETLRWLDHARHLRWKPDAMCQASRCQHHLHRQRTVKSKG